MLIDLLMSTAIHSSAHIKHPVVIIMNVICKDAIIGSASDHALLLDRRPRGAQPKKLALRDKAAAART